MCLWRRTQGTAWACPVPFDQDLKPHLYRCTFSPLVVEMDKSHSNTMFFRKFFMYPANKVMYLADYSRIEPLAVYEKLKTVATLHTEDFKFAMGDVEANTVTTQFFNLTSDMYPVLIVHFDDPDPLLSDAIFSNVSDEDLDNLQSILDEVIERHRDNNKALKEYRLKMAKGELEEDHRSQTLPTYNKMPVKVINADTWNEEVTDAGRDVVVHLFTGICMACKQMFPLMTKAAITFRERGVPVSASMQLTQGPVLCLPGTHVQSRLSL